MGSAILKGQNLWLIAPINFPWLLLSIVCGGGGEAERRGTPEFSEIEELMLLLLLAELKMTLDPD